MFVTFHGEGVVRGCVGVARAIRPLSEAIPRSAVEALNDPRFPPVLAQELERLTVEVSILSPSRRLPRTDPGELPGLVMVGEHGLVLGDGVREALLLPQVAVADNLTAADLLSACCIKAGLDPDAWRRDGAGLSWSVFEAQVFEEIAPAGGVVERTVGGHRPDVW